MRSQNFIILSFLVLFVLSFTAIVHAQSKCYSPDGKILPSDGSFFSGFQPCSSGGPSTICCATNRTNPAGGDSSKGDTQDECLSNGLCQNRKVTNGVEKTTFFADFCTSSNFTSGACLNVCEQTRNPSGFTRMTSCAGADSDRWCCGDNNACCSSGNGMITLPQKFGGAVIAASSSLRIGISSMTSLRSASSALSTNLNSVLAAPSTSSTSQPAMEKVGLSASAIAGIIVGAIVLLSLLIAGIFFALRTKHNTNQSGDASPLSRNLHHQKSELHADNTVELPHYNAWVDRGGEKYARHYVGEIEGLPVAELQQPSSELDGSPCARNVR